MTNLHTTPGDPPPISGSGKGIPLVSDQVTDDMTPAEPHFGKAYPHTPSRSLSDLQLFTQGHPWALYEELRAQAPISWHPETPAGTGFWALVNYEDIRAVELDTQTFSSAAGGININYGAPETRHPELYKAALNTMICLDQPFHMPLRRAHMPFFTPQYVAGLRTRIDQKIESLLDQMADAGPELDFVEHFAAQLPMFTLCEMLGIPEDERTKLFEWMHYLERAQDTMARRGIGGIDPEFLMRFLGEMTALFAYGRDILADRRAHPREDLLSAIANAQVEGELLSPEFLDGSWLLILFAGNDTTRNSLSGTIRLLTDFPDQRAALLAAPQTMTAVVDEAIRMVSPVIYMRRTATKDTQIGAQKIARGEKVVMFYGGANRDPAVFSDAARFDVARANAADHMAFGYGPHVCLGKRVANMQLEAALSAILARFPNIKTTGDIDIAPSNFVHAISRLGVALNG
ncbi:MAG: cytochrome P450 [Pseudomonadota bacterium]